MALALAGRVGAHIVISTDPDGNQLGLVVRDTRGQLILLNGNQSMILMTYLEEKINSIRIRIELEFDKSPKRAVLS
jgi:phosphomannomutase